MRKNRKNAAENGWRQVTWVTGMWITGPACHTRNGKGPYERVRSWSGDKPA